MAILYQAEGVKEPSIKKRTITAWINKIAGMYEREVGHISYIFCSDEKILEINKKYLKHDYYTDIITFDYSAKNVISGDIFISLDTVKSNSEKYMTDYDEELRRVIIHGILHLCGIDDKTVEDSKYMTKCENEALALYTEGE